MIKPIKISFRFLKYYSQATTVSKIDSPFVKDFLSYTLEDNKVYYQFEEIERLRRKLLKNKQTIAVNDFGAGSHVAPTQYRSISEMAKSSLSPPFYARLLFKIVHYLKPKTLIELGTSFGISTLYQATADRQAKMVTLEGCNNIATLAEENFTALKASNIELINAPFDLALPPLLDKIPRLDYIFVDGNHKREPTLFYFKQALKKAHKDSCFIFHDIHWTIEMEGAWRTIQEHPKVKISIDLFFLGIVFFKEEVSQKEHYTVIRSTLKPFG